MKSFTFLRYLNDELKMCIEDLTRHSNIFVKDIHIQEDKTIVKYEMLSKDGFEKLEITFENNKK